jgi:hypothetical protein
MMFSRAGRSGRTPLRGLLLGLMSATAVVAGGVMVPAAPAAAQDPPPAPLRNVKYTIFAEQSTPVQIYYRDVDPPSWADYNHNPYVFSPKADANVGPDQQWNLDVQLANPDEWAMVVASSGQGAGNPNIHCVLAIDGVVVKTHQGPKGALCSVRNW